MDNKSISKILLKTSQLLELHEANPFKVRSYQNAAFNIDKLPVSIAETPSEEWENIDGIGKNLHDKLQSILDSGSFKELDELLSETPAGVVEMLNVKGVGPKKIRSLWKDYNIDSKELLLQAAEEGKLAKWKGFGEKTQKAILDNLHFEQEQSGKVYFAVAEKMAAEICEALKDKVEKIAVSGETARCLDVVENLQFVVAGDYENLYPGIKEFKGFHIDEKSSGPFCIRGVFEDYQLKTEFILCDASRFGNVQVYHSCDSEHLGYSNEKGLNLGTLLKEKTFESEQDVYQAFGTPFIPAELREGMIEWDLAKEGKLKNLITDEDLKGTLHNHSTYSDGKNSLEEMAKGARDLGLGYLGISDHSKSAFYAGGLDEARIVQQHEEIDRLNKELAPFKIFKGIESDILNDGSLDYSDDVLASFDFIVSSIHSGLNMDERKATARLIRAIENPYTTILGHPTGRLLLKRKAYPINHKMIIDACAENDVIIEINANPWRLDLSWEWVAYALEKGVWISINPDAHELSGYRDMHYGVCAGRKGGLTPGQTFNALSAEEVEKWFEKKKSHAG